MKIIICFLCFLNVLNCFCQSIAWQKQFNTFYLESYSQIQSLDTLSDGGYVINCRQGSFSYGPNFNLNMSAPGVVFRLNAQGDTLWKRANFVKNTIWETFPVFQFNKHILATSIWVRNFDRYDTGKTFITYYDLAGNIQKRHGGFRVGDRSFSPTDKYILGSGEILFFGVGVKTQFNPTLGQGQKYSIFVVDTLGNKTIERIYLTGPYIYTLELSRNIVNYGNGNFAMYGFGGSVGFNKPFIIKTHPNFDTIATKTVYPSTQNDQYNPIRGNLVYTKDNSFVISGYYATGNADTQKQAFIMKLDTNGTIKWTFKVDEFQTISAKVFELSYDTLLLVTPEFYTPNIWIYKILKDGTLYSKKNISAGVFMIELRDAILKLDKSLIVAGDAHTGAFLIKINDIGTPTTANILPATLVTKPPKPDILGPTTVSCQSLTGIYVNNAIDYRANYTWKVPNATILGMSENGRSSAVLQWNIAGIHTITVTAINLTTNESKSGFLTVTVPVCTSTCVSIPCSPNEIEENLPIKKFSLFSIIPNPSQGNANITIENIEKTYHLVIYNAQGAIVYNHISNKSEHEIQNFRSGIYQVTLIIDDKSEHQKWVVE